MDDFSFLSDSDNEKAVDEILSQAMDQSVLEQVAAINCSGFTDSVLPTHLETRFRKLKSFPATKPTSSHQTACSSFRSELPYLKPQKPTSESESNDSVGLKSESDSHYDDHDKSVRKRGLKPKSPPEVSTSPSKSSEFPVEDGILSPSKQKQNGRSYAKSRSKSKTKSLSFFSPSKSWDSTAEPLSPPTKTGCFWCSPKKDSRKNSKENGIRGISLDWEMDDVFLSDLRTFSTKEQQKMLKKAMKEEEKIAREAEKIVQWAKQGSARIDVSGIDEELSDNESTK